MNKRPFIITVGVVVAAVAWYLFRPELLVIDARVNEAFPAAVTTSARAGAPEGASATGTSTLASGLFHGVAHETRGTATIHQLTGGRRVLRFTDFETSNGPDVRVLLIAAPDASDNDTVKSAQPVELGQLKGNLGDQNYDIPASIDLNRYRAVTLWCNRFSVNFGTAPLMLSDSGMPTESRLLVSGSFHGVAHETHGEAMVYQLEDGSRVLRLTNFETSNGPDVRVLLIAADDAMDNDTVKGAQPVELGRLKGNVGDQNYEIPATVDLAKYRAVTIWCNRFSVNFGTAPLAPGPGFGTGSGNGTGGGTTTAPSA